MPLQSVALPCFGDNVTKKIDKQEKDKRYFKDFLKDFFLNMIFLFFSGSISIKKSVLSPLQTNIVSPLFYRLFDGHSSSRAFCFYELSSAALSLFGNYNDRTAYFNPDSVFGFSIKGFNSSNTMTGGYRTAELAARVTLSCL